MHAGVLEHNRVNLAESHGAIRLNTVFKIVLNHMGQ